MILLKPSKDGNLVILLHTVTAQANSGLVTVINTLNNVNYLWNIILFFSKYCGWKNIIILISFVIIIRIKSFWQKKLLPTSYNCMYSNQSKEMLTFAFLLFKPEVPALGLLYLPLSVPSQISI